MNDDVKATIEFLVAAKEAAIASADYPTAAAIRELTVGIIPPCQECGHHDDSMNEFDTIAQAYRNATKGRRASGVWRVARKGNDDE